MESRVNFSGKGGHPNIQTSTEPGIEPGTSGLGGTDLATALTPASAIAAETLRSKDNDT